MVSRRHLGLGLASLVACSPEVPSAVGSLVLRHFRLVDPGARRVVTRDLVLEHGQVVARASAQGSQVIEGNGRFLLPALWDVKASLWGNNSALSYDELQQGASFTHCLKMQLFYGIAHVGVFGMAGDWASRYVKRADALGIDAAAPLFPDRALGAVGDFAVSLVKDRASLERELASRHERRLPLVHLLYESNGEELRFSLSRGLLEAGLAGAAKLGLKAMVLIDDWQRAAEAIAGGARLLCGLPAGSVPPAVVELMRSRGVAFAPTLTRYLELDRLLGNHAAIDDPFLRLSVPGVVLETFRDPQKLWPDWRKELLVGRARKQTALASVRALSEAGVAILVATDAGWTAGTFHGYSSHRAQSWLEEAGLSPWARLEAATSAPAAAFGRRIGFEPGDPANFVALGADPLLRAANLRSIELVLRRGKLVDRERLKPDLTRRVFKP